MESRFRTARFGELVYQERDVIVMPEGLIGLPSLQRWLLLEMEGGTPLRWLQSLDRDDFGFPVLEPRFFADGYEIEAGPDELRRLGVARAAGLVALVVTTIHPGGARITGNLLAPLLMDPERRRGLQLALECRGLSVRQELDYSKFGLAVRGEQVDDGLPLSGDPVPGRGAPERASQDSLQPVEVGV